MCKVIDAEDIMADARQLVEAIFMAATDLPIEQQAPIQTVADIAVKKMVEARDMLGAYREERDRLP